MNWSSDQAAEQLGVSLRTYKNYELSDRVKRIVELATVSLSLASSLPTFGNREIQKEHIVNMLQTLTGTIPLKGRP